MAAVVAVVLEVLPPATHFFFLCVAFGALAASIASFFATASWVAWVVFFIVTFALIPVLMPMARFLFAKRAQTPESQSLCGQKATVEEAITASRAGTVNLSGELWRARSQGETFEPNEEVLVDSVEGDHLVVRRS